MVRQLPHQKSQSKLATRCCHTLRKSAVTVEQRKKKTVGPASSRLFLSFTSIQNSCSARPEFALSLLFTLLSPSSKLLHLSFDKTFFLYNRSNV